MMSEKPIAFDSVLNLCQNQHRRIVLGALTEEQQSLTLNELTEVILKHNHQVPPTEASEDVLMEVRLSLRHVHLPKLDSEGFIDHDPGHQLVEPAERLDQIQLILSTILDADPSLEAPIKV